MTLRQTLLKWIYPLLIKISKVKSEKGILLRPDGSQSTVSFFHISVNDITGKPFSFQTMSGKTLLLVNTASDCGYTAQLKELQQLYEQNRSYLNIAAIPSNDFKNQEKLEGISIATFCQKNYGVSFPILQKMHVRKGVNQSALFQWLSQPSKNGWNNQAPGWNFWKYLIDENGELLACFPPGISPQNEKIASFLRKA